MSDGRSWSLVLPLAAVLALGATFAFGGCVRNTTSTSVQNTTTVSEGGSSTLTSTTALVVGREPQVTLTIPMTGKEVVPPVGTSASGTLTLFVNTLSFGYKIEVKDLTSATAVSLRLAERGSNGSIIAQLPLDVQGAGVFTGILAQGVLDNRELMGPLAGKGYADLYAAVQGGRVYVEVETKDHPDGELRGQSAPRAE